MIRPVKDGPVECAAARAIGHALFDGDAVGAVRRAELDAHLAGCAGCRDWYDDLARLRRGLRELPQAPFPDDALAELLASTSRSRPGGSGFDWRPLAAAAAVTFALLGLFGLAGWMDRGERQVAGQVDPSDAEVELAAAQARLVFKLTAEVLDKAEHTAVREIVEEVSPALRRVPLRWSGSGDETDEARPEGV